MTGFHRVLCFGGRNYGIGFPGGTGTRDMRLRLDAAGVPCWMIY